MTHTDRQPPFEKFDAASPKAAFAFFGNLLLYFIHATAVWWALLMRKPGTVGSRTYWIDVFWGYMIIIALAAGPDRIWFQALWVIGPLLYIYHLSSTNSAKKHVYRYHIGESRIGYFMEFGLGMLLGLVFHAFSFHVFGFYIMGAALCSYIGVGLIEERDKLRAAQIADAMFEQQYAMDNYERFTR